MKLLELEYSRTFPVAGEFGSVKIGMKVAVEEKENMEECLDRMATAAAHYNQVRFVQRNRSAILELRNVIEGTLQFKDGRSEDITPQQRAGSSGYPPAAPSLPAEGIVERGLFDVDPPPAGAEAPPED